MQAAVTQTTLVALGLGLFPSPTLAAHTQITTVSHGSHNGNCSSI